MKPFVLLFALLLGGPAFAAPCGPKYAKLAAADSSPAFRLLERGLADKFPGVDFTWKEGKKRPAKLEKIFQALHTLTPEERAALRPALAHAYPAPAEAPWLLRFAFHDEPTWLRAIQDDAVRPSLVPLPLGELRPFVEALPESTREKLLAEVGRLYPSAGKRPAGDADRKLLYPKRLLDNWLRVLLRAEDTFAAALAEGRKPLAAYQAYLDDVNARVVRHIPKGRSLGYGQIPAEELRGLAGRIQDFLRLPSTREHLRYEELDRGVSLPPRIVLYGSTIKGLARHGSDVDLAYSELRPQFLQGGERLGQRVPGLQEFLTSYLNVHFPNFGLKIGEPPHAIRSVEEFFSASEPFMVEITPTSIKLVVYSREAKPEKLLRGGPTVYRAPVFYSVPLD